MRFNAQRNRAAKMSVELCNFLCMRLAHANFGPMQQRLVLAELDFSL